MARRNDGAKLSAQNARRSCCALRARGDSSGLMASIRLVLAMVVLAVLTVWLDIRARK